MVQIAGKYQVVETKNFYELLVKTGVPEEHAKHAQEVGGTSEIQLDGNKISFISDTTKNELILNEEVDEKLPLGGTVKSTATLNGNVLTIKSKEANGSGTRVFTFSDAGIQLKIVVTKGDVTAEASRVYKRL